MHQGASGRRSAAAAAGAGSGCGPRRPLPLLRNPGGAPFVSTCLRWRTAPSQPCYASFTVSYGLPGDQPISRRFEHSEITLIKLLSAPAPRAQPGTVRKKGDRAAPSACWWGAAAGASTTQAAPGHTNHELCRGGLERRLLQHRRRRCLPRSAPGRCPPPPSAVAGRCTCRSAGFLQSPRRILPLHEARWRLRRQRGQENDSVSRPQ